LDEVVNCIDHPVRTFKRVLENGEFLKVGSSRSPKNRRTDK